MTGRHTLLALAAFVLVLGSCAGKRDYGNMSAEEIFTEATEKAEKKRDSSKEAAIEMFKEIQIRHAFSSYASLASVKTADVYFSQDRYRSAADQYKKFISDNPKHELRKHAMRRIGLSFFNMKESPKRDQSPCRNAIYWYQTFLSYYPNSSEGESIQSDINKCSALISESELQIGKFYMKRGEHEAARRRFTELADNFPKTEAARKSAKLLSELPPPEPQQEP